jgi:hypothetical protein
MGAFTGGLTYKMYFVHDALPERWRDAFEAGVKRNTFRPLNPEAEEERSIGWCGPHFPLDLDLHSGVFLYNEYIVLAMRIDTLKVPAPLLRIYAEQEARRLMVEQNQGSMSRYERSEIKERIRRELRKKILPSIRTIDFVWSWQDGVVRFFSTSEKLNLEFMELFETTFNVPLTPDCAHTSARLSATALTEDEVVAVDALEPMAFVDADTIVAAMKEV